MKLDQLRQTYADAGMELRLSTLYETDLGGVYGCQIPAGDEAVSLWEWLHSQALGSGYWPLLLGESDEWIDTESISPQSWLEEAGKIDAVGLLSHETEPVPTSDSDQASTEPEEPGLLTPYDSDMLQLALLPCQKGWQAAAFVGFGGWNDTPEPPSQVAVQKYWYERFGAEPVSMTDSELEMRVARPPKTEKEAMELARQHYSFCPDVVDQGVGSLDILARNLLHNPYWYFWWD
ncbi:MAG TPA: DUF4253 domain-containing protein [Candidatus Obscuribacterales bacterium]